MQIATLAFNKAARTEFMRDFQTPEARASALEVLAKAVRVYDRAAEYYQRRLGRTNPTRKLEHAPPGMGGTQRRAAILDRDTQKAKAQLKFEQREARINTVAGAKLDAIRENQHKQQQNARPAVAQAQATQQAKPVAQERPPQALRSIFNRQARETPTRAFNRSR